MSDFDELENIAEQLSPAVSVQNKMEARGRRSNKKRMAKVMAERAETIVYRSGSTPSMPKFKCLEEE